MTCGEAADAGLVTGCGAVALGCGQSKSCATCASGEIRYSDACCTPLTCAEAADAGRVLGCGETNLGCGQQKVCAPCPAGDTCTDNVCVTCVPLTCVDFGNAGCNHSDQCGGTVNCCGAGESCVSGLCCPPGDVAYEGGCCKPACDPDLPSGPQDSCGVTLYCGGAP